MGYSSLTRITDLIMQMYVSGFVIRIIKVVWKKYRREGLFGALLFKVVAKKNFYIQKEIYLIG